MTDATPEHLDGEEGLAQVDPTQVRFLTPDMCKVHLGSHGALHVTVKNERIYGGVYASQAFPAALPEKFVSLIYTGLKDRDLEIGIIRDLAEFPAEDAALIRSALARRYFIHVITQIDHIDNQCGCIALDVQTDKGPASFWIRWSYECAVDYGKAGKMLIDLDENRYLIPDVQALAPRERSDFQRYVYW